MNGENKLNANSYITLGLFGTVIVVAVTGTFSSTTYTAEGIIKQTQ